MVLNSREAGQAFFFQMNLRHFGVWVQKFSLCHICPTAVSRYLITWQAKGPMESGPLASENPSYAWMARMLVQIYFSEEAKS